MALTFSLERIALLLVASLFVIQGAVAQTGTQTLQDHGRRHTLAKRARAFQCGQIKSNSAQFPNVCICFDTLGTSVNFGESTAAVSYANSQGFRFPTSVSSHPLPFHTRVAEDRPISTLRNQDIQQW